MSEKPPLHVQVAEALGWTYTGRGEMAYEGNPPSWDVRSKIPRRLDQHIGIPRYDTDWSATGPLIEKYEIGMMGGPPWVAGHDWLGDGMDGWKTEATGETQLVAVCHLLLALKESGKL